STSPTRARVAALWSTVLFPSGSEGGPGQAARSRGASADPLRNACWREVTSAALGRSRNRESSSSCLAGGRHPLRPRRHARLGTLSRRQSESRAACLPDRSATQDGAEKEGSIQ